MREKNTAHTAREKMKHRMPMVNTANSRGGNFTNNDSVMTYIDFYDRAWLALFVCETNFAA